MKKSKLVHIEQVCTHFNVEVSFIQSLHELGHIELIDESNDFYIIEDHLKSLESLIYFHTELQINLEGIDAIAHLLKKIENLQNELAVVKNKWSFNINDFK